MGSRYSVDSISRLGGRKVFFDANVLIYVFWPSGAYYWEPKYSKLFNRLLHQKNELLVDFIVISEIINRAHRLEYDKHIVLKSISKSDFNYKSYRNSKDGQEALSDIYLVIEENILKNFTIVGKFFSKEDIKSFLTIESLDIADKGILHICRENNCVLLTHDVDFKNVDIDVLTSNSKILFS